jgi:hypothetical protein
VVHAYVDALDRRDGKAYCSVVAHWISGRFDLYGADPEASLTRTITCPEFVHGFIGYIEDCCPPEFIGARVTDVGDVRKEGDLLRVPFTVELVLEENKLQRKEPLEDTVWLIRDRGAWRVAYPSLVSRAASIGLDSETDYTRAPDVAKLESQFVAQRDELEQRVAAREASYRPVGDAVSCDGGLRILDPASDIDDWQHPAPPSPTPQPGYADLAAVLVDSGSKSICLQWELARDIRLPATFDAFLSNSFHDGDPYQSFEIDVRRDGTARIVGGTDVNRHEYTVPGRFGISGNAASLVVDEETFAVARQHRAYVQYKPVFALGTERFAFGLGVKVRLSAKRQLHDFLGTESAGRYIYPTGEPCSSDC